MEYFNFLVSLITNDARCTCETKFSIAVTNSTFVLFQQEIGLKSKEETIETLRLELSFLWC
jgi:hypothetical protein